MIVTPVDGRWAEWDAFVAADPASTFCHRAGWSRVMSDVMRQECEFLVAQDESGQWRGILPLVHVRGLLGHYLVSMPFLDDGGPIGDAESRTALADEAIAIAKRSNAKIVQLRAREEVVSQTETLAKKVNVQLPMPDSIEALWEKTFKAKLRSQVRKPSKEGMTAKVGLDQLDAFYEVFSRNMRDLGTPVLPRAFFESISSIFDKEIVIAAVYSAEGKATAGSLSFASKNELYVTWASSLREYNRLSPNMLLYATLMEEAVRRGLKVFNFGRSTPGAPTHKFKQQWGGLDHVLPWAAWPASNESSTPTPDKPAFKVATAVWSRLPMFVANRVGPVLARQLP